MRMHTITIGKDTKVEIWSIGDIDIYTGGKNFDGDEFITISIEDIEKILDEYNKLKTL